VFSRTRVRLLALPLSPRQVWAEQLLAAFAVGACSTALFVAGGYITIAKGGLEASDLVDLPLWWSALFATAVFCFTSFRRARYAIPAAVLLFAGIMAAAGVLVCSLGASLLGFDPAVDGELWGLVSVPGLLLASRSLVSAGPPLGRRRRWPAALGVLASATAVLGVCTTGLARVAARYNRPSVQELTALSLAPDGSVLSMNTMGSPVWPERTYRGWGRRRHGPDYRAKNIVLLDLRTGKDLLVRPGDGLAAVSRQTHFAAVLNDPPPVTWRSERYWPGMTQIETWDLRKHRRLYRGIPRAFGKLAVDWDAEMEWSPDGSWLALREGPGRERLLLMTRDGSRARVMRIPSFRGADRPGVLGRSWAWAPSGRSLYVLDRLGALQRHDLTSGPKTLCNALSGDWRNGHIAVSPDGHRVAVALETSSVGLRDPDTNSRPEPKHAAWLVLLVIDADRFQRRLVGIVPAMRVEGFRFLWSSDSKRLYAFVPEGSSGPAVLRWEEGDQFGEMMRLPTTVWVKDVAVLPGKDELLLWGYDGVLVADRSGLVRDLPSSYLRPISGGHDLIGVDHRGFAVVTSWPLEEGWPDELRLADLLGGKIHNLYP
jgi:hypothetical protein